VALGHVHGYEVVRQQPLTAYAGATAYSRDGKPGCLIVDLVPARPATLRWVPLEIDRSFAG
jgi:hypothetical protein